MGAPTFDLQSHSTCSDGALAPAAVVAAAADAGVELLALTDHDTVDGVDEALQAGAARGLRVVPAVELSALDDDREDLHVLGYLRRPPRPAPARGAGRVPCRSRPPAPSAWPTRCAPAGSSSSSPQRASIGRPHLAQAAFDHPANRMRLAARGDRERLATARGLSDPRRARLPPAHHADRRRGDRARPRRRRGRRLGAPVLGRRRGRRGARRRSTASRRSGLDGVEAFYPTPRRRADRA